MSSLCRLQEKISFHHAYLDCHQKKFPFSIICGIKVLLDPGSFKKLTERVYVDYPDQSLAVILYSELSFNLVTFTFSKKFEEKFVFLFIVPPHK